MRLCSHVVTADHGLAPNPFHGYCTSALCTPSHVNARLQKGDWLIGHSTRKDGNRLVYAMCISEVLTMDQYFHDSRFADKKPKPDGTLEEQCGDNFYYKYGLDRWRRLPSRFHNHAANFIKDVGKNFAGHPVFVAEHFYYFGCRRIAIPEKFQRVIRNRQGIHYRSGPLADEFVTWLEANYKPGVLGKPRHMEDHAGETGRMLIDLVADCTGQTESQERSDCRPKSRSFFEYNYPPEVAVESCPVKGRYRLQCLRPADLAKALRQRRARLRLAAGADDPHAERGAQPPDLAPDPTSADHADGLAVDEERPIGPMIERAGLAIDRRPVEAHCEMQNASDGIFRDRQRIRHTA